MSIDQALVLDLHIVGQVLVAHGSSRWMPDGDGGPNYLTVLPAATSALISATALFFTARVFVRDRKDRARAQAYLVYAWLDKEVPSGTAAVTVFNNSDQPVWNVSVRLRRDRTVLRQPAPTVEGDEAIKPNCHSSWRWEFIPATIAPDEVEATRTRAQKQVVELSVSPELRFTDAAGRDWEKLGARVASVQAPRWRWPRKLRLVGS